MSKLNHKNIDLAIIDYYNTDMTLTQLEEKYNIHRQTISKYFRLWRQGKFKLAADQGIFFTTRPKNQAPPPPSNHHPEADQEARDITQDIQPPPTKPPKTSDPEADDNEYTITIG